MRLRGLGSERRGLSDGVLARTIVETSSEAFIGVGTDGVIEDWNTAAEQLFGLSRDDAIGHDVKSLLGRARLSPPGDDGLGQLLLHAPGDERTVVSARALKRGGVVIPVEVALARGAGPSGWSTRAFVRDLSRWVKSEPEMPVDPLTGLPTAGALTAMVTDALERERSRARLVAVCHVDVDRTGLFNDALGHQAGDELLVAVKDRLASATRLPKAIVRYGGDEFVAVVDQLHNLDEARSLAARLVRVLSNPLLLGGREVFPSASVGVAVADPARQDEAEAIVAQAVLATRRAKGHGGASFELFDRSLGQNSLAQLELEADLRLALERDELRVHYQPLVRPDGRVWGYEALVRWQHPDRGLVGPGEFLAIAESTGLISAIGDWILRQAARQLAAWRVAVPGLRLAVNLSPRQLVEPDLASRIASLLDDEGMPIEAVNFEASGAAILNWPEVVESSLDDLAGLGAALTLDDFGVGYASLLHLRRLPVSQVKLDRFLLASLERRLPALASLVRLAHDLDFEVAAIGVETPADLRLVAEAGVDLVQGHLVSAALPGRWIEVAERLDLPTGELPGSLGPRVERVLDGYATDERDEGAEGRRRRLLLVEAPGDRLDSLLDAFGRLESLTIVGHCTSVEVALDAARQTDPDVVLVDLRTDDDVVKALPELARRARRARLIARSPFATPAVVRSLHARGVDLCVDAAVASEELVRLVSEMDPLETPRSLASLPGLGFDPRREDGLLATPLRHDRLEDPRQMVSALLDHALAGRHDEVVTELTELRRAGCDLDQMAKEVLQPALEEALRQFDAGTIGAGEVHLIEATIASALESISSLDVRRLPAGSVALVWPPGEPPQLFGRLLAEGLRQRGWQALVLGSIAPNALKDLLHSCRLDAVLLSCTSPVLFDVLRRLIEDAHSARVRVLAHGVAFGTVSRRAEQLGADGWARDAGDAAKLLSDWRRQHFDLRAARDRLVVVGARAEQLGEQAQQLAMRARAGADSLAAGAVLDAAVQGAISSLLLEDETVLADVTSHVRRLARRVGWDTAVLPQLLVRAAELADDDLKELARAQLEALGQMLGGRVPRPPVTRKSMDP